MSEQEINFENKVIQYGIIDENHYIAALRNWF